MYINLIQKIIGVIIYKYTGLNFFLNKIYSNDRFILRISEYKYNSFFKNIKQCILKLIVKFYNSKFNI